MMAHATKTAKQEVISLLQSVPATATLEDIQHHIYVLQKILKGLDDVEHGRVISQDDVERQVAKWARKSAGPRRP